MNKLKLLLVLLMGSLFVLVTQRVHLAKSDMMKSIYSDIVFTRLSVESQQYTRQIEYGLQNGKSLENFYNVQSVLASVKRCCSYTDSAYIVSSDYRVVYSLAENGTNNLSTISVTDFKNSDEIYSVYDDKINERYLLTLPIYGMGDEVCGFMVLGIDHAVISNSLADYVNTSLIQAVSVSTLCFLLGVILIIHCCKRRERLFRDTFSAMTWTIGGSVILDGGISVYRLLITIESIIQQSVSKITMTLQNDLDTLSEKGVSLSKIYDLNSWLLESCEDIPFIDNLIYDKNYNISAVVSDNYISRQIAEYAWTLLLFAAICVTVGLLLILATGMVEKKKQKITKEIIKC